MCAGDQRDVQFIDPVGKVLKKMPGDAEHRLKTHDLWAWLEKTTGTGPAASSSAGSGLYMA
jgi:hypothetical protein